MNKAQVIRQPQQAAVSQIEAQTRNAARAAVQALFPPAIDNPTTGWMELGADSLDLRAIAESVDRIVASDFNVVQLFEFNTFAMLQNHIAGEKPHDALSSTWRVAKSNTIFSQEIRQTQQAAVSQIQAQTRNAA